MCHGEELEDPEQKQHHVGWKAVWLLGVHQSADGGNAGNVSKHGHWEFSRDNPGGCQQRRLCHEHSTTWCEGPADLTWEPISRAARVRAR